MKIRVKGVLGIQDIYWWRPWTWIKNELSDHYTAHLELTQNNSKCKPTGKRKKPGPLEGKKACWSGIDAASMDKNARLERRGNVEQLLPVGAGIQYKHEKIFSLYVFLPVLPPFQTFPNIPSVALLLCSSFRILVSFRNRLTILFWVS